MSGDVDNLIAEALTGNRHVDGGTLIQHMEDAHTPHAVPEGDSE